MRKNAKRSIPAISGRRGSFADVIVVVVVVEEPRTVKLHKAAADYCERAALAEDNDKRHSRDLTAGRPDDENCRFSAHEPLIKRIKRARGKN